MSFTKWWFASTYFVLYLIFPYLNKLLNSFSKKEYGNFILGLTFLWCIFSTLTDKDFQSNPLLWFIYLYSLAGYIRLYGLFDRLKAKTCILFAIFTSLLTFLSAVIFDILGLKITFFSEYATYFFEMQKLLILIISVLLFLEFSRIDIGFNSEINIVASATFSVYLILYSILVIVLVYVVCTLIELMRIYLVEKSYVPLLNRISEKLEKKLIKFQDFICKYL